MSTSHRVSKLSAGVLVAWTCLQALPATAQNLQTEMRIFELVDRVGKDGRVVTERLTDSDIVPGDRVLFRVELANEGEDAMTGVSFDMPVAKALVIDPRAADGDGARMDFATRSAPGTFAQMSDLVVVDAETGVERPAVPADIGQIRVTLADLAPTGRTAVEYAATVR